jgi:hypothetical protein
LSEQLKSAISAEFISTEIMKNRIRHPFGKEKQDTENETSPENSSNLFGKIFPAQSIPILTRPGESTAAYSNQKD